MSWWNTRIIKDDWQFVVKASEHGQDNQQSAKHWHRIKLLALLSVPWLWLLGSVSCTQAVHHCHRFHCVLPNLPTSKPSLTCCGCHQANFVACHWSLLVMLLSPFSPSFYFANSNFMPSNTLQEEKLTGSISTILSVCSMYWNFYPPSPALPVLMVAFWM